MFHYGSLYYHRNEFLHLLFRPFGAPRTGRFGAWCVCVLQWHAFAGLEERADAAAALYESGVVGKILVSGDDGTLQYDEVYPIGKYLEVKGIPRRDIFLDYAGFDTYSSMYRARAVFDVSSMVITTQRFHLPRALFLARAFGISAVGLDSSLPGEKYFDNSLREIPASVKALLDVLIARVPKYLGQQYPITGDGRATWVASTTPVLYFPHGTQ